MLSCGKSTLNSSRISQAPWNHCIRVASCPLPHLFWSTTGISVFQLLRRPVISGWSQLTNSCHICVPHYFIPKVYQLLMATIECQGRSAVKLRDHDIGRFEHIHFTLFYLLNILPHIVNASVLRFLRQKVGSSSCNTSLGNQPYIYGLICL